MSPFYKIGAVCISMATSPSSRFNPKEWLRTEAVLKEQLLRAPRTPARTPIVRISLKKIVSSRFVAKHGILIKNFDL
jgi:hypothetical protein